MNTTNMLGFVALAALALGAGSCTREPEAKLLPASGVAQLGRTGIVAVNGVQIRANGEVREAIGEVAESVTPIEVSLYNGGEGALRIRYDQFWIADANGYRYAALPPFHVHDNAIAHGVVPADFVHVNFAVAPAYAGLYPGMLVTGYDVKLAEERAYQDAHYAYWLKSGGGLPSEDMLRVALPEGVLSVGGRIDGYLYFERVPESAVARLHVELVDALENRAVASASIPFE